MLLWGLGARDLNVEVIGIKIISDFRATDCVNSLGARHREKRRSPKTEPLGDSGPLGRRHSIRS